MSMCSSDITHHVVHMIAWIIWKLQNSNNDQIFMVLETCRMPKTSRQRFRISPWTDPSSWKRIVETITSISNSSLLPDLEIQSCCFSQWGHFLEASLPSASLKNTVAPVETNRWLVDSFSLVLFNSRSTALNGRRLRIRSLLLCVHAGRRPSEIQTVLFPLQ